MAADKALTCRIPARPLEVKLLDVSSSGCRLKISGMRVLPGATVHIDLPDGSSLSGTAVWYEASKLGVKFESELDEAQALALGLFGDVPAPQSVRIEPLEKQPRKAHWLRRPRTAA